MPRNARLRASFVAAIAAAFLVSVGPAAPAAAAATPTTSARADVALAVNPPDVIAATAPAAPTVVAAPAAPALAVATPAPRPATPARTATSARAATPARTTTRASQVIAIAKSKLGDRWVYGATGPGIFDCSGLVIFSFKKAGVAAIVGSGRKRSARALYAWFRDRGLASRTNGKPGDLVICGGGTHVGIYLGNGMAISTLMNGVRVHAVRATTARFTAFLHTGIAQKAAATVSHKAKSAPVATKVATVIAHRVTATALRLRSAPSATAHVLSTLPARTRLSVVRVSKDRAGNTWYRVLVGGRLGWLAGRFTRAA